MYYLGILSGILSGIANFLGQILQKKAINDINKRKGTMTFKDVVTHPVWISGMACLLIFSTLFLIFAQLYVGPALIPGLIASGFIVLAIGSAKILGEKLNKEEIIAIGMLMVAIICLSASKLSIEPDMDLFKGEFFVNRIAIVTSMCIVLWLYLFYLGRKSKKKKAILLSLGTAFPFIVGNIWMAPFIVTVGQLFSGALTPVTTRVLIISTILVAVVNIGGMVNMQIAMAEGNASIVIPMMQIPQQLSPVIIYFVIYAHKAPHISSYFLLIIAIALITYAGFLLTRRQTELESCLRLAKAQLEPQKQEEKEEEDAKLAN